MKPIRGVNTAERVRGDGKHLSSEISCLKEEDTQNKSKFLGFRKLNTCLSMCDKIETLCDVREERRQRRDSTLKPCFSHLTNRSPSPLKRQRRIKKSRNSKKEGFRPIKKETRQTNQSNSISNRTTREIETPSPVLSLSINISFSIATENINQLPSPSLTSLNSFETIRPFEMSHLSSEPNNQILNGNHQTNQRHSLNAIGNWLNNSFRLIREEKNKGLKEQEIQRLLASRKQLVLKEETKCVICISDFQRNETAIKLSCGHYFHSNCIAGWLKNKSDCPICRKDVVANK